MYLVYLCFGENSAKVFGEIIYSLLSFDTVCNPENKKAYTIVIYSDKIIELPKILEPLEIKIEYLDLTALANWLAQSNSYTYVVKPRVIELFLAKFQANVLFVDSDTFFLHDPIQLFRQIDSGDIIMHLKEFDVLNRMSIASFFLRNSFYNSYGKRFTIGNFAVWNSGAIGLGVKNIEELRESINLIEQITNKCDWPSKVYTIEQIALSYYFGTKQIRPAERHIIHYWFFKPFRYVLAYHFGYFHLNDMDTANALKRLNEKNGISYGSNKDKHLSLLKKMVWNYVPDTVFQNLLKSLPLSSSIGKILRE